MTVQGQPLELVPGEVLDGKYRVERLLGVGGMGAVYVAERLPLQDKVAIKSILSSQNTEVNRARFLREARAAASVRHPNVVKIFDFGEPRGRPPYMVMEYLAGPTLATIIRDYAPIPLARALWIFSGICAAVEAGHRRGVIHRDLKPGNVILSKADDGRETVKVLDFGLARLLMETEVSALTSPGTMLGTCSYMSPELIEANLASAASDIYALGVVLYEMVTGHSPFRAENNAATIWKITSGDYERPSDLVPDLPQEVSSGIEAALARRPEDRPKSPEELAARVGAPLAASASEHEPPLIEIARSPDAPEPPEVSGIDLPRPESAPSISGPPPKLTAASEVTTADVEVNIAVGGERTMSPLSKDAPAFSDVFIGRASELDTLRREYRMTLDGRGRIVVIKGDAGVGKSRLLGSFGTWARSQGAVVLRGRFFSYEGDQPPPYETFLWMLTTPASSVSGRLPTHNSNSGPRADPELAQDKWRAFSSLTSGFTERSGRRPLVLTVDDLQWGTALDLEFLAYLPRALENPVMIVGTARNAAHDEDDEELSAWLARLGSQRSLATVGLEGFGIGEVRAWFQACFPGIRIRPQDLRRLQHATSGNPYYLTEVVGQLVQARRIVRNAQGYSCAALDQVALPDTVNSVVQAKLEGLDEELRSVLEMACVIGEEFRFEILQAACGVAEEGLETLLERAVKRRLLSEHCRSPLSDFRFDTPTLRSVLYDGLSRRKRRRLHRKVVDALLVLHGQDDAELDRIARLLCYHYHAVEDNEGTLRWGLRAAADTLAHYDHDQAELSLHRAHEAAEALAKQGRPVPQRAAIELDRLTGLLYVRIGRLEEADAVLQRALETAESHADQEGAELQRLDILLILAGCQLGRGLLEMGIDLGQMAIDLAEQLGDATRELEARLRTGRAAAAHGQLDSAIMLIEPLIELAEGRELAPLRALAMTELAAINVEQGAFDRAHSLAQQASNLAASCGDLQAEYAGISVLGKIHLESGDFATALGHLESALEMARSLSLRRREGLELHQLATCRFRLGNLEEAEARAREALAIFLEIHDLASEGDCRVNLGRVLLAQGSPDEGLRLLEAGRELCATVGRRVYEGLALLELGVTETVQGALREAHEHLERASELFGSIDSLHLWRSELALARLALAEGDRPRAATHARRAAQLVDILRSRLGHALDQEAFSASVSEVRELLDAMMR
ncbi:MAG: protein kinase [Myxococcales bacterium]|nr:protein kinase [Myxococcales bacterium]MCB9714211.1 protein kinase [Myxococcales bacterium]